MKKLLFLGLFVAFSSMLFGQGTLREGELQANAGLGFSSWGIPVIFGADYGITDDISVGGEISFRRKTYSNPNYTHSGVGILAVGNYHFNNLLELPSPFDLYAGMSIGAYFWSTSNDSYENDNSGLGLRLQIGGRYFFTEQWGVNLELGGGSFTDGRIGVTFKF